MDIRSASIPSAPTSNSQPGPAHHLGRLVKAIVLATSLVGHGEVSLASGDSPPASTGRGPAQSLEPTRAPPHAELLEQHQRGERRALRVREDTPRHRLWVLTLEHVYVYDIRTRKLLRRMSLPNWPVADFMCPPDLVLGRDGTVYVSNNVQPKLLQIDPANFRKREHQLRLVSDRQWEIGFGALGFTPDGRLFGLSTLAQTVFSIDLAGGTAREVGQLQPGDAESMKNACALTLPEHLMSGRGGEI